MKIFSKILQSNFSIQKYHKWVNQRKFARAKEMKGFFLTFNFFLFFSKIIFSDSDNELETQAVVEKSNSKKSKPEK